MTLDALKNLNRDDILGAMGLETKRSTTGMLAGSLAVFGVGLLVGAAAALLLAPKAGEELREDVGNRFRDLKNRATRAADSETNSLT